MRAAPLVSGCLIWFLPVQDFVSALRSLDEQLRAAAGGQVRLSSLRRGTSLMSSELLPTKPDVDPGLSHYVFDTVLPFLVGYFHTSFDSIDISLQKNTAIYSMRTPCTLPSTRVTLCSRATTRSHRKRLVQSAVSVGEAVRRAGGRSGGQCTLRLEQSSATQRPRTPVNAQQRRSARSVLARFGAASGGADGGGEGDRAAHAGLLPAAPPGHALP